MPILSYKTNGKQIQGDHMKIYFCGSAQNFHSYFERISKDIWNIKDAVIFYDSDAESGEYNEEWWEKLSAMHMFIAPITSIFLETENRAKKEFEFALEKKIPVLPFLCEYGIEQEFNEKFKALHSLALYQKKEQNSSRVNESYQEMLQRKLESILIDGDLLERIRNEKETYMFVSYRKKDFQQANKFMKSIHDIEGCDNIGFWYDDYLMPGENFEDSIQDRLENSEAVGLIVTPNIVALNENKQENYVVVKEYPMAKESNKQILAVEMEATDKEELKRKFSGLDEVVSLQNREYLREFVKNVMGEEKKQTDEHRFLMGMAYLKGIAQEINIEKGTALILEAGEKKYIEAIEKLVQMYGNGDGVAINKEKELYWQEILVDKYFKLYGPKKSSKKNNVKYRTSILEKLSWESFVLGRMYEENYNTSAALKKYEEAINFCRCAEKFTIDIVKSYLHLMSAYIQLKRESIDSVQELNYLIGKVNELQSIGTKLIVKSKDAADMRLLQLLRVEEADLYVMYGDEMKAKKAIALYKEAYEGLKKLTVNKEAGVYYSDMEHVMEKLGDVLRRNGKDKEAEEIYLKIIQENLQILEKAGDDDAWTSLSINYEKLGDLYRDGFDGERLEEAEVYLTKAMEISKRFTEDASKNNTGRQLDLAGSYRRLGGLKELQNQLGEAERYYQSAFEIHKEIYEKNSSQKEFALRYAENCTDLADIFYEKCKKAYEKEQSKAEDAYFEQAENYYKAGAEAAKTITITLENAYRRQHVISRYYYRMATLYLYLKQDKKTAEDYLKRALKEVCEEMLQDDPEFVKTRKEIMEALKNLNRGMW